MLTSAARRRIAARRLCAAAALALSVVLAGAGLAPGRANEFLLRIGDVRVPAGTVVHGDAIAVGGNLYVDGTVEGDAFAFGGSVDVGGHVTGSVRATGGNVVVRSTAVIDGAASAVGGTVTQEPGASVGGQQAPSPWTLPPLPFPGAPGPAWSPPPWWIPGLLAGLVWVLHSLFGAAHLVLLTMFVGAAWALAVLFPHAVARVGEVLERDAAAALAVGVLTWPILAVLTVLLVISIVGVPLALSVPAAVVVAAQFGLTAIALIIGKRAHPSGAVREIVVGAVLLAIAFSIPGFGHLVGLAAATWGIGAVVVLLSGARRVRTQPPGSHPPASPQAPGPTAAA